MIETIEVLKQVPLFSELNDNELEKLKTISTNRKVAKREYVFMEGEKREAVFFIQSGTIKTFKVNEEGNEQVINLLQAGEMFPHVGFFDNSPYPATAEVKQEAQLIMIRIDHFDELMMDQPRIAMKVMKIIGQKIFSLTERIQELMTQDVQHRVIYALIRLAHESGTEKPEGVYIDMPVTNQDIANMVGSSRETVNRVFNQLKKEKLVDANRSGILIYDLKRLKKASGII